MPSSLQTHQVSAEGREKQPAAHGEEHRGELKLQPEEDSDPLRTNMNSKQAGRTGVREKPTAENSSRPLPG